MWTYLKRAGNPAAQTIVIEVTPQKQNSRAILADDAARPFCC